MTFLKKFPQSRNRRLRQHDWIRSLVAESHLRPADLIQPIFIVDGPTQKIDAMPGIYRHSVEDAVTIAGQVYRQGIKAIALFPVVAPELKSIDGAQAYQKENLVCRAIGMIKASYPNLGIIADVALDPYTTHGHDGIIDDEGYVQNDLTVAALVRQALVQAEAGCDIVAPSDMMDGRVGQIRAALDEHGFERTLILSYAAKYASSFYGPFREAVGSKGCLAKSDKRHYQQDYANSDEAMHEIAMDIQEGADWVMIKPGMPYLDIVFRAKQLFKVPICVYQVSGEYTMLYELAAKTDMDFSELMMESLVSFKRAGASTIFCYAASEIAQLLSE